MEIVELNLKHYGKFENHRMTMQPGINIIYGGNETGKTTLHSFIRSMFFGLNRGRGKAAKTDEYQVRQPWDTPGAFLGSMRIRENGEIYRIDRCFDRSAAPLQVTCETRAQESANPQEDLNALLGGISENAFVNTVFVRQAQCETDESLAEELRRYMVNSDRTMDGGLDVTQALQTLRKKKKAFEQKKKKEDELLESKIEKKQAQAEQIRSELDLLRGQLNLYGGAAGWNRDNDPGSGNNAWNRDNDPGSGNNAWNYSNDTGSGNNVWNHSNDTGNGNNAWNHSNDTGSGISAWNQKNPAGMYQDSWEDSEYEDEDDWDERKTGKGRKLLEILLFAAGLAAFAGAFLMQEQLMKIFLGVFGAVFLGMILVVHFLLGEPKEHLEEEPDISPEEAKKRAYLEAEIQKREAAYQKLQNDLEALYHEHVRLDGSDTEIAAITLAIDRICELTAGIYAQSGGQLNEHASRILSEITEGRYNRIVLDELSEVRIHTPSRVLGLHQVSGGTLQQIYFALRMAAGELLGDGVNLPIVLDEAFALYDDDRLEAALRWLKNSGRQVILFTCQKREREILQRL